MQTDSQPSTSPKGTPHIETSSNVLGLTEEDIDYIRQDMFEYSKTIGYDHDDALKAANLAANTLARS